MHHFSGTSTGRALAAERIALIRQRGALSAAEQLAFSQAYDRLPAAEKAECDRWLEAGFCRICAAAGIDTLAGYGPEGDLCESCAAEIRDDS